MGKFIKVLEALKFSKEWKDLPLTSWVAIRRSETKSDLLYVDSDIFFISYCDFLKQWNTVGHEAIHHAYGNR